MHDFRCAVDRVVVFFSATAPSGMYPNGHTLALLDAVPIEAAAAAFRGAPRGRRGGSQGDARGARAGHRGTDALRLFVRKLAATRYRSHRPDGAAAHLHPIRSRRTGRGECRSEEHTSELQSLMRISYAVFCLKKKRQLLRASNTTT